jgi:hypothetical protein
LICRGAKEVDNSQVTEPLKEQIQKGDVHTIDEMKAWLKPFGYSDANMNATYDNICTMQGWFSDEVKRDYKSRIDAMEHKDRYCTEFKDLNQSRNNLVHGDANTPSFTSTKEKYEHVKLFLEVLDEIMH